MTVEPHSGACGTCGEPIILARLVGTPGREVTLDPEPADEGAYRAHLDATGAHWLAWRTDPDERFRSDAFRGSRRRVHACWRGRQLVIGEEPV